jgi:hypothetical protein
MDTVSLTVRYRPIRLGWCIRAGDKEGLRKAVRLSLALWGGSYNPIIPVDETALARSLVDRFRIDALWPISADPSITSFIAEFPHLPNPFLRYEIFGRRNSRGKEPILVYIFHPIKRLYQEEFRNNTRPGVDVSIHTWQVQDPLADVFLCTLGQLPTTEEAGTDYLAFLRSDLRAKSISIENGGMVSPMQKNETVISAFSRAYLKTHYIVPRHSGSRGFYVGSADSFDDLVSFWNLRAADADLMFFDPAMASRLDARRATWLEQIRSESRSRQRKESTIAVWFRERDVALDLSALGKGLALFKLANTDWGLTAPYMFFAENRTLATIGRSSDDKPRISFQLPSKPLADDVQLRNQYLVASITPVIGL